MALVLIVHGDQAISRLLRRVLIAHGHEALIATAGTEALDLLGRHPALVFLELEDVHGPGVRLLSEIRAREPRTNVVALIGRPAAELEEAARQLGVTDFVFEGAPGPELQRSIAEVLDETPAAAKPASRETIAIVDDEPAIVRLLADFLRAAGFDIVTADNGVSALALIERTKPHLVLLDLYMPVMNGVEVLRRLRSQGYRGTVIV